MGKNTTKKTFVKEKKEKNLIKTKEKWLKFKRLRLQMLLESKRLKGQNCRNQSLKVQTKYKNHKKWIRNKILRL